MSTREPHSQSRPLFPHHNKFTRAPSLLGSNSSTTNFLGDSSELSEGGSTLNLIPLSRRANIAPSSASNHDPRHSGEDARNDKSILPLAQGDKAMNPSRSNQASPHQRLMAGFRSVFFTPGSRRALRQYEDSGIRFGQRSPGFVDVPPAYTNV